MTDGEGIYLEPCCRIDLESGSEILENSVLFIDGSVKPVGSIVEIFDDVDEELAVRDLVVESN